LILGKVVNDFDFQNIEVEKMASCLYYPTSDIDGPIVVYK